MIQHDLIALMAISLTPVILISGIGLLLLSMTNRIARPLDRIRFLGSQLKEASKEDQGFYIAQIEILYKRCFLLQKAITAAVLSIISVSVIILFLFFSTKFSLPIKMVIEIIFVAGILALIVSLIYFLRDIRASLNSVEIEMKRLQSNYSDIKLNP